LQLGDPGPFFWRKQAAMLTLLVVSSRTVFAVLSGNRQVKSRVPFLAFPSQLASAKRGWIVGSSRQPLIAFGELQHGLLGPWIG